MHKVLVHECFRDRRLGGMWGLGLSLGLELGTFCGHIAVQIPMMYLHQRHALVSAVQGLEESHHGCQTPPVRICKGVASIVTSSVPVNSQVSQQR
jgi:hypothetical protein